MRIAKDKSLKPEKSYGLYSLVCAVTADATAGKSVPIPFNCTIIDVISRGTAASSGGTVKLTDGTNDITPTIACAADGTITRVASLVKAYINLTKGGTLKVVAAQAADRGVIEIIVRKR